MSQAAAIETVEEVRQPALVRRFEPADLSKHGPWLLKRFATIFPELPEKLVAGYLSGLIFDNEHAFFYQDHAVALAQLVHSPGIKTVKVVQERFVWVEDIKDKDQLENAADFYSHIKLWGTRQNAERLIVCESSDVPKQLIEARLGRLFDTKVTHARV
jgi:hypothetical protein